MIVVDLLTFKFEDFFLNLLALKSLDLLSSFEKSERFLSEEALLNS